MRAIFLILVTIITIAPYARAAEFNPLFNDNSRQFALDIGAGLDCGFLIPPPSRFVPFSMLNFRYSLPNTFFELPARQSINLAQTIGFNDKYGWNWNEYSIPIIYLSEDIALLYGRNWYFGAGVGAGMQAKENERISSKLLFQFKLFLGYRISNSVNAELFMTHFSNGVTTSENNSYAFYGLGIVYNF